MYPTQKYLRKITVGKKVKQINMYAFDGIGKKLDIVWLSSMLYKSPFMKILPAFEDIDSICAPKRNFAKAGETEKRALVCGYIRHPEYESEFSEELKKEYFRYINEEFASHFNELCDRGMIMEMFLTCYERKLIEKKEVLGQFISYIKSKPMTKEDMALVESVEDKEGLSEQAKEDEDTKKLRRYIREHSVEKEMQDMLARESLKELPEVFFAESAKPAPVEALKFVLVSYISQWTHMDNRPTGFRAVQEADYVKYQNNGSSMTFTGKRGFWRRRLSNRRF